MDARLSFAVALLAAAFAAMPGAAAATLYGPSAYVSLADSPFAALGSPYLETFEDGLNAPGVTAPTGTLLNFGALRDSVDADDGSIDGSGSAGTSWYSGGSTVMKFSFDATLLGSLPTHVGIVWTDVGFLKNGSLAGAGGGAVELRAYDAGGALVGAVSASGLGDGAADGKTAEDRFFGIASTGGIKRIEFEMADSDDWEADHLQYGVFPVPVPAAAWLVLTGFAALRLTARRAPRG